MCLIQLNIGLMEKLTFDVKKFSKNLHVSAKCSTFKPKRLAL